VSLLLLWALVVPAQITLNGVWIDTLRPDWRVEAGLEPAPTVAPPAAPAIGSPAAASPAATETVPTSVVTGVAATPSTLTSTTTIPSPPAQAALTSVPDTSWFELVPDSLRIPTLSVRQAEIRDLLPALGQQHGVNVVLDPAVTGKVSLTLRKVRLRDVLGLVARDLGLSYAAEGKVLRVKVLPPVAPPPVPEPVCTVRLEGGLVSLDAQGAPLDRVVRELGKVAGMNVVVRGDGNPSVRLLLQGLPPRRLLAALSDAVDLEWKEQAGVFTLHRAVPLEPSNGANGIAVPTGSLRLWLESDSSISIEGQNASLSQAVSTLAEKLGLNLVVLGALQGQVTLRLQKASPETVLEFLFAGSEYTWWKRDGAWVVGPSGSPGVANSELLVLKHIKAEDALELVPQSIQRNAQLKLVKSHNGIMVLGSRESIEGIRAFLKHLDFPVPQILIEALVVDIDMDKVRNIGLKAFLGKAGIGSNSRAIYPNVEQAFGSDDATAALGLAGLSDVVTLPKDFFLKINALEQEKLLQVRSRPQISTLNGSEAKLAVGQTQYFLLNTETNTGVVVGGTTTQTTQRFEKIEANVTLTVTPYVTGEGEITCEIVPDFSEPEGAFDPKNPPTINHRYFKSKVRLRDGETIILGGLVKESLNRVNEQVPLLGSIPILGNLFKNHNITKSRSQLMIFVTPHIYYGEDAKVDPDKVIESFGK
jgi:type II secretory pathway component GspD/PulD (secretin)